MNNYQFPIVTSGKEKVAMMERVMDKLLGGKIDKP
jgi:hypothetical protein